MVGNADKKIKEIEQATNISFINNLRKRLNEFIGMIRNDSFWLNKGDLVVGKSSRLAERLAIGTNNQVLVADSTTDTGIKWGSAGSWTTVVKTAAYTAVSGEEVLCDTVTTGAFTVTLPLAPSNGDRVRIVDSKSNFATANLTVGRNSQTIRGVAADLVISTNDANHEFIYNGTDSDWEYVTFQTGGGGVNLLYRVLHPTTGSVSVSAFGGDLEVATAGTISAVGAYVDTAGDGACTFDIFKGGTTILSTKITIEANEKSSRDAATQPVLSTTAVVAGDILTFSCLTVAGASLPVGLTFRIDF